MWPSPVNVTSIQKIIFFFPALLKSWLIFLPFSLFAFLNILFLSLNLRSLHAIVLVFFESKLLVPLTLCARSISISSRSSLSCSNSWICFSQSSQVSPFCFGHSVFSDVTTLWYILHLCEACYTHIQNEFGNRKSLSLI